MNEEALSLSLSLCVLVWFDGGGASSSLNRQLNLADRLIEFEFEFGFEGLVLSSKNTKRMCTQVLDDRPQTNTIHSIGLDW